ncbi:MAG: ACP S-malonyltransferase [Planctomycetia bacterium]|nr:MAG: ACP S-malonyltransferase [Planctomycetia bacterium]
MTKAAAIFPGQGAQLVGMGRDIAEQHACAREVFARADAMLGIPLSVMCFDGPEERLGATDVQQPAIFTTSVAIYHAAIAAGRIRSDDFVAMGGLSLGEYTALHLAGAIEFEDALRLVHERGRLMQAAAEAQPGGMVTVLGLDEAAVLGVCERLARFGRISPANFNTPGQIVISGDRAACEAAPAEIEAAGGKHVTLKVAGAFHSELMRPAADSLRKTLDAARIRPPRIRVIANVDAGYHGDAASIRESLFRQVFNPVRWQACVERLIADGCDEFREIGPNRHLSGMMRKINRAAKAVNISTLADLSA